MANCPRCNAPGLEVEKITVAAHTKEERWPLGDEQYNFCDSPSCEVIYFTSSGSRALLRSDVKTRITFKEKGPPRPLCYCKQVTEEDVISAIEKARVPSRT